MSYEYNFYVNPNAKLFSKFIMDYFTIEELHNRCLEPFLINGRDVFSISTKNYSLNIQKAFWRTVKYMREDYNVNITISLSFLPYEIAGINGINMMIQFIALLLSSIDGDCVFMPNGDYIGLLRREGKLFIDTSKSCFNGVNLSLFNIPYIETKIDV